MVFSSQIFLFWYLPAALLVYSLTPRPLKSLVLTLVSLVFSFWWRPVCVVVLVSSMVFDFLVGIALGRVQAPGRRKALLVASIVANLGLLAFFKYADFGIESVRTLMAALGHPIDLPLLNVLLPLGISLYTFQSMSYTIDVYRKEIPPVTRFFDYTACVSMFPHQVAGPIIRFRDLGPQMATRTHSMAKFATGALLLQIGLAKKVLLADMVRPIASAAFALPDPRCGEAWLGTAAYAFQIYFDFSGYSDMAIGLGLMLGFVFPVNFDAPYRSRSITDFWRRWHMSLSTWLRDYLYVPMGGNRKGAVKTYVFLMLTMLLGGLWHGASWTFVIWGAWQGAWLVIERLAGKKPLYARLPGVLQVALTFAIVLCGWVLFRAESLASAGSMLGAMFGGGAPLPLALERLPLDRITVCAMMVCAGITWLGRPTHEIVRNPSWVIGILAPLLFLAALAQLYVQTYSPFLYFAF